MHPYTLSLKTLFEKNADPAKAEPMKKYMRDQYEYLGIKSPQVTALLRGHIKEHGLPPLDKLDIVLRELWSLPQREFQYTAMNLMERFEKKVDEDFITTIEYPSSPNPGGTQWMRSPATPSAHNSSVFQK